MSIQAAPFVYLDAWEEREVIVLEMDVEATQGWESGFWEVMMDKADRRCPRGPTTVHTQTVSQELLANQSKVWCEGS